MMALASLTALGLAILLGFLKKKNTGLLCTALALLVGRLAGLSDVEIIRGFNYSLFIMLLGVTYLFCGHCSSGYDRAGNFRNR